MSTRLISRTARTALLLGGAAAFALSGAPTAAAQESGPDVVPVPQSPLPEQEPGGQGGAEEEAGDGGDGGDGGGVGDHEIFEVPEDVLCLLLDDCEEGGEEDGAGAEQDCEMVHTPFGKVLVCDEDDEPEPPEGCQYLLGHDGDWVLECPDDEPPPEDCVYVLNHDGDWVLECPDDEPPPEECRYLLGHDGDWVLDCPDPEFDPCEDPEDGGTPVGCEPDEKTPGDDGPERSGLPLTGPASLTTLAALAGLLGLGGTGAVLLARRRGRGDEHDTAARM